MKPSLTTTNRPKYYDDKTRDPRRQWIRDHPDIPPGPEGFCFEDLDGICRVWGKLCNGDSIGKYKLLEWKWNNHFLDHSQFMQFHEIDAALRASTSQHRDRYLGFYLMQWPGIKNHEDDMVIDGQRYVTINNLIITWEDLVLFLKNELTIPAMWT